MTTSNLGDSIDVYAAARRRLQSRVCMCHGRSVYGVNAQDPSDTTIYVMGFCKEHADWDVISEVTKYTRPHIHPKTPDRFTDTDVLRLHPSMQKAVTWSPVKGKPGLLMHGTSGIGKTRAAWHITNRMWLKGIDEGFNMAILFLPMREFERRMIDSFEERKHSAALDEVCESEFLVLDDLGKERLTSRMATDLFSVIDHRTERDMPTIVTTNFSGKAFIDRFLPQDKETGLAIARRIRDYFTIQGMNSHENKE